MTKTNPLTKKQTVALVATTATAVVVTVVVKRKINALTAAAAANAVERWVRENASAGFRTYLLDDVMVQNINTLTNNALPTAA